MLLPLRLNLKLRRLRMPGQPPPPNFQWEAARDRRVGRTRRRTPGAAIKENGFLSQPLMAEILLI